MKKQNKTTKGNSDVEAKSVNTKKKINRTKAISFHSKEIPLLMIRVYEV